MLKNELFAKVRQGQIRIVFGSTQKMGVGTNIQDKLMALHDLDCPWRTSDLEQRAGRILRQGNTNTKVQIYRYVTKSTFDSYLYQTFELKQTFISQIMTSKNPVRSCEDVDESVLSYAEIKALAAGNPRIKEKMELDVQVAKLRVAKTNHKNSQYSLQNKVLKELPATAEALEKRLSKLHADITLRDKNSNLANDNDEKFHAITIDGSLYTKRDEAGQALASVTNAYFDLEPKQIGNYRGFEMSIDFSPILKLLISP